MSSNFAKTSLWAPRAEYEIKPWSLLDQAWTAAMGYHPEQLELIPGKTPLLTLTETIGIIVLYYAVIFGGREIMHSRPPFKFNVLFMAHNLFLTMLSGGLLVLFLEQLIPLVWRNGLYDGICGGSGWTDKLVVLYYLNYITKYIELLDTVFLVLKKKPLTFLHCYHHPATVLLCYTQLVGHTSVSWVPITLNLTVHVVMYWYYFQSARGIRITWKEWITRLQIAQFVIDLGFVYFASWDYFTSTYWPTLPHIGTCAGEEFAAVLGCGILSSYLLLFVSFYMVTYRKSRKENAKKAVYAMKHASVPSAAETAATATHAAANATHAFQAVAENIGKLSS